MAGLVSAIGSAIGQGENLFNFGGPFLVQTITQIADGVLTPIPVIGAPAACIVNNAASLITVAVGEGASAVETVVGTVTVAANGGGTQLIPVIVGALTTIDGNQVISDVVQQTSLIPAAEGAINTLLGCLDPGATASVPTATGTASGSSSARSTGTGSGSSSARSTGTGGSSATSSASRGSSSGGSSASGPTSARSTGGSSSTGTGGSGSSTTGGSKQSQSSGAGGSSTVQMPKFTNAAAPGQAVNSELLSFMAVGAAAGSMLLGSGFLFMMF